MAQAAVMRVARLSDGENTGLSPTNPRTPVAKAASNPNMQRAKPAITGSGTPAKDGGSLMPSITIVTAVMLTSPLKIVRRVRAAMDDGK